MMDLETFLANLENPDFVVKAQKEIGDAVAIATTTFYRGDNRILRNRARLTETMIQEAVNKFGYGVFVVDGGSDLELIRNFEQAGAEVLGEEKHAPGVLGIGRRQAIRAAYETNREVIVWMEPEKTTYVSEIVKTALPITENLADLTVPERKSLDSYPYLQQLAEKFGNGHWRDVTGLAFDVWFGPKTFRGKHEDRFDVAKYFLDYDGWSLDGKRGYGDKWDSTFLPIIDAHVNGAYCISVPVDYEHPIAQTRDESGNPNYNLKRVDQLYNLMYAISYRWKEYGLI